MSVTSPSHSIPLWQFRMRQFYAAPSRMMKKVLPIWQSQTTSLLLDNVPGSRVVVIFDAVIRRAAPSEAHCRPVRKVHIDQTPMRLGFGLIVTSLLFSWMPSLLESFVFAFSTCGDPLKNPY